MITGYKIEEPQEDFTGDVDAELEEDVEDELFTINEEKNDDKLDYYKETLN